MGTGAVAKKVADAVNQQYQVEYAVAEVEERATVAVRGQKIDLTQRRREAQRATGLYIARALAVAVGSELDKLIGIVAVGGGSTLITQIMPGSLAPADPQWANAQGYWQAVGAS